jgi:hypothetical protein
MNFGPSQEQTELLRRKRSSDHLDAIDRDDTGFVLAIGVKMRTCMRLENIRTMIPKKREISGTNAM